MALSKSSAPEKQVEVTHLLSSKKNSMEEVFMGLSLDQDSIVNIVNMLTDLYKNPIEATVREIVSNAIDATVLSGSTQPVEITSPSIFHPFFEVRDYGVGMSREEVKNIYSQYGNSTKVDNFNLIGAKGMGAKAPLSYCMEYTVETVHDGYMTFFTIGRNNNGNYARISPSVPTTQGNGTLVRIPVREEDVKNFHVALNNYKDFSFHCPISIDGNLVSSHHLILIGDVLLDKDSGVRGNVWVKKDCMTFFANILKDIYFSSSYHDIQEKIFQRTAYPLSGWVYNDQKYSRHDKFIFIELKPGVLDFSTSRDEITYNNRFETLKECITQSLWNMIQKDYVSVVHKIFSSANNEKELLHFFWDLFPFCDENVMNTHEKKFSWMLDNNHRIHGVFQYDTYTNNVVSQQGSIFNETLIYEQNYVPESNDYILPYLAENLPTKALTTVRDIKKMIHDIDDDKEDQWSTVSLYHLLYNLARRPDSPRKRVIILSHADSSTVDKILSMRKYVTQEESESGFYLLWSKEKLDNINIPSFMHHFFKEVRVYDAHDCVDYVKKNRLHKLASQKHRTTDEQYMKNMNDFILHSYEFTGFTYDVLLQYMNGERSFSLESKPSSQSFDEKTFIIIHSEKSREKAAFSYAMYLLNQGVISREDLPSLRIITYFGMKPSQKFIYFLRKTGLCFHVSKKVLVSVKTEEKFSQHFIPLQGFLEKEKDTISTQNILESIVWEKFSLQYFYKIRDFYAFIKNLMVIHEKDPYLDTFLVQAFHNILATEENVMKENITLGLSYEDMYTILQKRGESYIINIIDFLEPVYNPFNIHDKNSFTSIFIKNILLNYNLDISSVYSREEELYARSILRTFASQVSEELKKKVDFSS